MKQIASNLKLDGNKVISYTTHVATIEGDKLFELGKWSQTTTKHVNKIARLYNLTIEKKY
jgi:hypothetical protein